MKDTLLSRQSPDDGWYGTLLRICLFACGLLAAALIFAANTSANAAPVVTSISPDHGPTTGDTDVRITGQGLNGGIVEIKIDGRTYGPHEYSDTELKFRTPSSVEAGPVSITVLVDGVPAEGHMTFTYEAVASDDASLSGLTVSDGTFATPFSSGTAEYEISVPRNIDAVRVTPTSTDPNATVRLNGTKTGSGAFEIKSVGKTTVRVVVTAEDQVASRTYTLNFTKVAPLVETMTPTSGPATGGTLVTLTGEGFDDVVGVSFGGRIGTDFQVEGGNTIRVTTPANSDVYSPWASVNLLFSSGSMPANRNFIYEAPKSTNASLSGLTVSGGTFAVPFAADTLNYNVSVASSASSVKLMPMVADANATVEVNGHLVEHGAESAPVTLKPVGSTSIPVVVTAEDGTTIRTYEVSVSKRMSLIRTVTPNSGPVEGGTRVVITGSELAEATGVMFNDVAGTDFNVDGEGNITVTTPAASGNGAVNVKVVMSTGSSTQINGAFTYGAPEPDNTASIFTPAAGALPEAMAGEPFARTITLNGATAPLNFSLLSGELPEGVTLKTASGELSGTIAEDAVGAYSFAIQVKDGANTTATVNYTLNVVARQVTVADTIIEVPAGSAPKDVRLDSGATGGPFNSGNLTFVEPANAGTAAITWGDFAQAGMPSGPVGWYLKFTPDPAYSGTVRVGFRLTSALGLSNNGTVTYKLGYDAGKVAADIDSLVHGFVGSRQSMISSTIKVPGLLERRQAASASDPVTTLMSPSGKGMTLGFSTSLAQLEAARNQADGIADAIASPFNIWIDGTFMLHNRDQNDSKWGSFGMISTGADYLLSDKALIGLSFHYDRMTDPTGEDAELTGNGWLAGPYASFEIGRGVVWDTSLLYGGSANDIDTAFWDGSFDTTRWMIDTAIKGQWNLDDVTVLTPKLRAVYFSETVDDYAVRNFNGDELGINGFTEEQLRVSLGAEIARQFTLENGAQLTPKLGLTGGVSGLDGSGAFGQISAGLSMETTDEWSLDFSLLFNIAEEGEKSAGAKAGVSKRF